jgi:hypothetical protein
VRVREGDLYRGGLSSIDYDPGQQWVKELRLRLFKVAGYSLIRLA